MKCWIIALVLATTLRAQERHCVTAQQPNKLPAVSSLLDSAAAVAAFGARPLPPDGAVFSVVNLMDSVQTVRLLEPSAVDSMPEAAAVFRSVLLPQQAEEVWGVHVRIRPGGAISLERSRYCPPIYVTGALEVLRFDVWAEDRLPTVGGRPVHLTIEASLSSLGDVIETRVLRSSGIQELDREVAESFRRQKFLPALLDDVPVASWIRSDGHTLRL